VALVGDGRRLMPRVTVVTATYNWATVLPFCIASVRAQSFGDFEHLVIGDACTDESADAVIGAADGDPRIRWLNLASNTGHQSGPNSEGIRLADSDFIAYLGHDDLWTTHHLENLVAALDAPGVGLVHSSTVLVHPSSAPAHWPKPGWRYERPAWIPPSSVMHRRDVAVEAGGWTAPEPDSPDPEALLWAAIAARLAVRWVPCLTCIKLPAEQRRGVYRDRPCHEQAYWLDRIGAADDPEQDLARALDEPYSLAVAPRGPAFDAERLSWAVRTRARRLVGRAPVTGAERLRLRRQFKGLD